MDATLKDLLWKFLTCLLVFSCFSHFFSFFLVSSDTRSSQLISSRLARANLISAHFMWEQMCCAKDAAADILCKQQCTYPLEFWETTCLLNAQFYQFTVLWVHGNFCKFTKFTVLRSESSTLRSYIYDFTVFRGIFREQWNLPFYGFTVLRRAWAKDVP